jgi:polysaccharide export outer membrane protein
MLLRILCCALLALCCSVGAIQRSAAAEGATAAQKDESAASAPVQADSKYIIGPGDTLQVFVWRNPELSTTVPVRPDGQI